jgi:HTH-type transcriptional regulator/antitoxin MqsA
MDVRSCANCGLPNALHFEDETFSIGQDELFTEIKNVSGWRCATCGEIEFDSRSAQRYAAAGDDIVLRTREMESTATTLSDRNEFG